MRYVVYARKPSKALIWEHSNQRSAMRRVHALMELHRIREEPKPVEKDGATFYELDLREFYQGGK